MASIILRPTVVDFLDVMMHSGDMQIRVEQVTIPSRSCLDGKSIGEARIGDQTGAMVLAVHGLDGKTQFNPGPTHTIQAWEQLIVMGRDEQIEALKNYCEA